MNERIRQLAVQAHAVDNTLHHYNPEFIEKFAKLIIQECANRASWAQDTNEEDIGGEIIKHFGVQ
jgi:hypothetical protein